MSRRINPAKLEKEKYSDRLSYVKIWGILSIPCFLVFCGFSLDFPNRVALLLAGIVYVAISLLGVAMYNYLQHSQFTLAVDYSKIDHYYLYD